MQATLTFLLRSLILTLKSPAFLDLFISSDASICSAMAFPPLGNSDHVVVSVSIDFPINSKRDAPFHRIAYDYSRADWDGLRDHLRDVPWEDIFKLSASAAASEFCEWFQVGINVCIPHHRVSHRGRALPSYDFFNNPFLPIKTHALHGVPFT